MGAPNRIYEAVGLHVNGHEVEAERLYRAILGENPREATALHYLGVILYHRGEYPSALELIRQSLDVQPNVPEAFNNLGLVLGAMGKSDESIEAYRKAIEIKPDNFISYSCLASAYLQRKEIDNAIDIARKALEIDPNSSIGYYNLGASLQQKGDIQGALEAYKQALVLQPDFAEAYCNLGLCYTSLRKNDLAVEAYRKAVEIKPNFPEALNNMGLPLNELRRLEETTEVYRRAISYRPGFIDAYGNLATILRKRGFLKDALAVYERGFSIAPNSIKTETEIINLRRHVCDWKNFENDSKRLCELADHVEPFVFLNVTSSPQAQLACARVWSAKTPAKPIFDHSRPRKPGRIRIGYLSSDFRRHATAYLMAELFERHDRERFETFAYSYGYDDDSDVRKRLVASFDHFIDFYTTPQDVAAAKIYEDGIDILIDLKGYTGDSRTEILAFRAAPVQVNFIGFPGTMGADFIDYILADPFVAPAEHQPFFQEKIVHLPNCYQPNDTKRIISDRSIPKSLCNLPDQGFVFCCFNGSYKITPVFFDIWMRLLKAVPGSVLWILATSDGVDRNLCEAAQARGVDPKRLVFAQGLDLPLHLARHKLADLFLDTLPICAHTTASDALWAGLPILTCVGNSFVGRVAGSLLKAVGLPELICHSLEEYEQKALDLATHPEKLSALRKRLDLQKRSSPLFDIERYTHDLENAFVRMFEIQQRGEPPQSMFVPASE